MNIEIISEANDKVTNNVIEYLTAYDRKFIRKILRTFPMHQFY